MDTRTQVTVIHIGFSNSLITSRDCFELIGRNWISKKNAPSCWWTCLYKGLLVVSAIFKHAIEFSESHALLYILQFSGFCAGPFSYSNGQILTAKMFFLTCCIIGIFETRQLNRRLRFSSSWQFKGAIYDRYRQLRTYHLNIFLYFRSL